MTHLLGFGTADSWDDRVQGTTFMGPATVSLWGGGAGLDPDLAHWKEGTTSTAPGTSDLQEAAMDPTLAAGVRKVLTRLDVAALSDVGWTPIPQAVPLPASAPLLLAALAGLVPLLRRARLAGEPARAGQGTLSDCFTPLFGKTVRQVSASSASPSARLTGTLAPPRRPSPSEGYLIDDQRVLLHGTIIASR